jgi:hypothetical protein
MKRSLGWVLCIGAALALVGACQQGSGVVKVDRVEPPQGTTAGGEEITIVGDGYLPGKTQAEVRFGHKKAETVTIASTSKIKVVTPPGDKGPVDITVSFDDGRAFQISNAFRYVEPAENAGARNAFFSGKKGASGPGKIELEKK